jgi:glucokinase
VYIGTDGGATTSKVGGVWDDGHPITTDLLQVPTDSKLGPDALIAAWVRAIGTYLDANRLAWSQVRGVGLAIPGPFKAYGVWDKSPNLPESFVGYPVHARYAAAIAAAAGRSVPLAVGNDGNLGGVAEAARVRGDGPGSVVLLAPGSGLGCAFIDDRGLPLDGDFFAGMEAGHLPAVLHLLGTKPYPCGCGRTWGCIEVYTTIAGLPYLLAEALERHPEHPLATSSETVKHKVLSLRTLAQSGDALALEIFDFQARAMGLHVATLAMALDPKYVVIGGGLMDPGATTEAFRERYLRIVRETARPHLWPEQRDGLVIVPAALGDLSQAIGAALVALYRERAHLA